MPAHMGELVGFPDSEALCIAYLAAVHEEVGEPASVSNDLPNPRPLRHVKVTRTGGVRRSLVQDEAQMTFECWAADTVAAAELARLTRARMGAMDYSAGDVHGHYAGEVGGPVEFPDPDVEDRARYQFTATVRTRAQTL